MSLPLILGASALGVNALSSGISSGLNYKAQKANLEWQKYAQRKTWEREDNAVQRRIADLEAAGLSKVLAAGQGASSGPVVKTDAPQFQYPDQANNIIGAMNLMKMKADISKTDAERRYIDMQKSKARVEKLALIDKNRTEILNTDVRRAMNWHDLKIARKFNTRTNIGGHVGQAINLYNAIENLFNKANTPATRRNIKGAGSWIKKKLFEYVTKQKFQKRRKK